MDVDTVGLARTARAFRRLLAEELLRLRLPWRADGALAGFTAAFSALTVRQAAVREVIDRLTVPTLFLWASGTGSSPENWLTSW